MGIQSGVNSLISKATEGFKEKKKPSTSLAAFSLPAANKAKKVKSEQQKTKKEVTKRRNEHRERAKGRNK